jgi:hypothetical protein
VNEDAMIPDASIEASHSAARPSSKQPISAVQGYLHIWDVILINALPARHYHIDYVNCSAAYLVDPLHYSIN